MGEKVYKSYKKLKITAEQINVLGRFCGRRDVSELTPGN